MGFGQRIGDTLRVPGRGFHRGITVLVVLILAAATGGAVALTAPALVGALRPAQPRAVVAPPLPVPVLGPLPADVPAPTPPGLSAALDPLADASALADLSAVVVDPTTGVELWGRAPDEALVPGSTVKLLTAAAALLTLNPTSRLVTRVLAGADPGTVILVGGGDPTLSALPEGENGVYPDAPRLAELADEVRATAPGPVTEVLVDTSRYTGPTLSPSWDPADVPGGFIAPIEPVMLDGGRVDPTLQDGRRVFDPALAAGRALAELLGADPDSVAEGAAPEGAMSLGSVSSAPVTELVEHVVRGSDNVLAEVLLREVAIDRGGEASFAGGVEQTLAALTRAGFDTTGVELDDGSGLSTGDLVPARVLGALLAAAAAPAQDRDDTEFLRPMITGLSVAGGDGTLDERFGADDDSAPGRGVVRAKTGTLTGVSSLAGIVTDVDGRLLVFALISNGGSPTAVRPRLDTFAATLSRCGCR